MDIAERAELERIVRETIGAVYEVARVLGAGFLEKVYERSLQGEILARGLHVKAQVALPVHYKGNLVGQFFADLVVEQRIIVELKCCEALTREHLAQCINYLRASRLHLALLVNFQHPRVEWKRIVNEI